MNNERSNTIAKIIDAETSALWTLHAKLGGEYASTWEQLDDMITLGERARAVKLMREARATFDRTDR